MFKEQNHVLTSQLVLYKGNMQRKISIISVGSKIHVLHLLTGLSPGSRCMFQKMAYKNDSYLYHAFFLFCLKF